MCKFTHSNILDGQNDEKCSIGGKEGFFCFISEIITNLSGVPVLVDVANIIKSHSIDGTYMDKLVKVLNYVPNSSIPIMVYKNREDTSHHRSIISLKKFTKSNKDLVFILPLWCGKKNDGESYVSMKKRYKHQLRELYPMFSRDDYIIMVLYHWLYTISYIPLIISNDKFRDMQKYRYLTPFSVIIFFRGKYRTFYFDNSILNIIQTRLLTC